MTDRSDAPARGAENVVARARDGDEAAWRELYGTHAARLVIWLRTLPAGDATAGPEDVASEAWLTAARRIADFHGDSGDFAAWLFTIARNVSMNHRRTSVRRRTTPTPNESIPAATGAAQATAADPSYDVTSQDATRTLLARLPERQAQVVACIDVVGLDVATTGKVLGISSTAVRVAHHRGLNRLRRLLATDDDLSGDLSGE